jgi:type IX secretion system PorP/SprF family membrane protein
MRKLIILFICIMLNGLAIAQSDARFSQNMFNHMAVNPGYAGISDMVCINALNRNQFIGMGDASPMTTVFSANTPLTLLNRTHGLGVSVIRDQFAFNVENTIKFSYAYISNSKFGDGKIGIGISLGAYNSNIDPKIYSPNSDYSTGSDPDFPTKKGTSWTYDLGLGVFYKTEKLYFGLASTHIPGNEYVVKTETSQYKPWLNRHYYATAGYSYQLPNPMYTITPSFFFQSDGKTSLVSINANLEYNNRIWGGLSYSAGVAATGMIGFELMTGVRIGFSYDFELTEISQYSSGSTEFVVIYCFKLKKEKQPQKYKSIRFL